MASNITTAASSPARLASTRSFRHRFDEPHQRGRWSLPKCRGVLLTAVIVAAISSTAAFAQPAADNDRCKAGNSGPQAKTEQAAPAPDSNSSDKLKDCDGVLKPPVVGDSALEKPAPKVGRTPVIKPDDNQNGQHNDQQPGK